MKINEHPLKGWMPYKLVIEHNIPLVHWLYGSDTAFNRPFFENSISQCKSHKYNSSGFKCMSILEDMVEWSYTLPEILPITLIFHISRCGSTILSQLIGLNSKYIVLA